MHRSHLKPLVLFSSLCSALTMQCRVRPACVAWPGLYASISPALFTNSLWRNGALMKIKAKTTKGKLSVVVVLYVFLAADRTNWKKKEISRCGLVNMKILEVIQRWRHDSGKFYDRELLYEFVCFLKFRFFSFHLRNALRIFFKNDKTGERPPKKQFRLEWLTARCCIFIASIAEPMIHAISV